MVLFSIIFVFYNANLNCFKNEKASLDEDAFLFYDELDSKFYILIS